MVVCWWFVGFGSLVCGWIWCCGRWCGFVCLWWVWYCWFCWCLVRVGVGVYGCFFFGLCGRWCCCWCRLCVWCGFVDWVGVNRWFFIRLCGYCVCGVGSGWRRSGYCRYCVRRLCIFCCWYSWVDIVCCVVGWLGCWLGILWFWGSCGWLLGLCFGVRVWLCLVSGLGCWVYCCCDVNCWCVNWCWLLLRLFCVAGCCYLGLDCIGFLVRLWCCWFCVVVGCL